MTPACRYFLCLGAMSLALLMTLPPTAGAQARASAQRGAGPFVLKTKRERITVRLLRQDNNVLWVLRPTAGGDTIESGIALDEIVEFEIPEPRLFEVARAADTPAQARKVQALLERLTKQLMPYRDLPGMIVDEALLLQGWLAERQSQWEHAAVIYEDLIGQQSASAFKQEATMRAGLCYAHLDRYEQALAYLNTEGLSDEDLSLVSEVYAARGDALVALKRYEEGLLSYLYLVVFYPFIDNNEPRCLAAALPCYASLAEWEPAYQTVALLREEYPGTRYAQAAEDFAVEHEQELKNAGTFQDLTEEETEPDEERE